MIYDYSIKRINNEEILYLFLDISIDFKKTNIKNINSDIKSFIKKNNINFKGKAIALVVGGIVIGTVAINKPVISDLNNINPNTISVVLNDYENEEIVEQPETIEELKEEVNEGEHSQEQPKQREIQQIKSTQKKEINNKNIIKENVEKQVIQNEQENIEDTNTYITLYRQNGSILTLELEEYVIGVVSAEMPASFNEEALKAQAILSRTYALKSLKRNTKLTDNNSTQNYKDVGELKALWQNNFDNYYNKIKSAVLSTKGLYLIYNGELIEAVYHSTSNGKTEDSKNVWGNSFPYLVSTSSEYDYLNPSFYKEVELSYIDLSNKLNIEINKDTIFNIVSKTISDRVEKIEINGKTYTGVEFRDLLKLRSADFEIRKQDSGVIISTKGYGHGVGMSQYGANGMAKNGYNYETILKHYYKGVTIQSLNN